MNVKLWRSSSLLTTFAFSVLSSSSKGALSLATSCTWSHSLRTTNGSFMPCCNGLKFHSIHRHCATRQRLSNGATETNEDTSIYVSTGGNKLVATQVDKDGNLVKVLQTIEPVVDAFPIPEEGPVMTEWISRHPKLPLLYALTSFWNNEQAVVTTFRIGEDGTLTKLGSSLTGGHQAAHAAFSSNGSTYVVAHHNDGKLSFFESKHDGALGEPIAVIDPPEIVAGTRVDIVPGEKKTGLPSLHGVTYAPNGKYLLAVDPQQNAVFTYAVDADGRPKTRDQVSSQLVCATDTKPLSWVHRALSWKMGFGTRVRRAAIHPNGKFVYILFEMTNYIQVYEIDEEGKIDPECQQEISCISSDLRRKRWVGLSFVACAELEATEDALIVSIRGFSKFRGRCEHGVRLFTYENDGRELVGAGSIEGVPASVRHFHRKDDVLWVGMNSKETTLVQKYIKKDGWFELSGKADVGVDVLCVTS